LSLPSSIKNKTLKVKINILHIENVKVNVKVKVKVKVKLKVKQSYYRLEQALRVTGG